MNCGVKEERFLKHTGLEKTKRKSKGAVTKAYPYSLHSSQANIKRHYANTTALKGVIKMNFQQK